MPQSPQFPSLRALAWNKHKCWDEHMNYDRISTLTGAAMACCKECRTKIDREIDGLMYEVYCDGYNMEGWEPKH